MSVLAQAREIRRAMDKICTQASDAAASAAAAAFPRLRYDGSLICAGSRIFWKGSVLKAAQDLWDTRENDPDHAANLWAQLNYRDGYRIIPEVIPLTEAFAQGEPGWWEDGLYVSLKDGNVYTPGQYPAYWEKRE